MAGYNNFMKSKQVTYSLGDEVRAQLVGGKLSYFSSGSEHSGDGHDDDSPSLSKLLHAFLEDDCEEESVGYDSGSERVDSVVDCGEAVEEISNLIGKGCGCDEADLYGNALAADVRNAISSLRCREPAVRRRELMSMLRDLGHNAAICKTKWSAGSGGLTAGSYEFIDVIAPSKDKPVRYFIDLDFSSEFEIARPNIHYVPVVEALPKVFIGRGEELKKMVKITCEAAKRSLKSRGLSLPPWRKNRYMQNKWFGPYKRTTNPIAAGSVTPSRNDVNSVSCRTVGFENAGRLFVPTRC